jgi:hypothetical protein
VHISVTLDAGEGKARDSCALQRAAWASLPGLCSIDVPARDPVTG